MECAGSVALEATCPNTSSKFADEGTAAHELASMTLNAGGNTHAFLGRVITVNGRDFAVDEEMAGYVQEYVDKVLEFKGDGVLMVEQKLPIGQVTGEAGATGTGDAVILRGSELQVHDLKYGRGVEVDAQDNEQLMLYALGALHEFEAIGDFTTVRLVIHQPRRQHLSEWDISVEDLKIFGLRCTNAAGKAMSFYGATRSEPMTEGQVSFYFEPGESQCRFCRAKAICPALGKEVTRTALSEFEIVPTEPLPTPVPVPESPGLLASYMDRVGMIEDWCAAIRAKVNEELNANREVPGWKLVLGKKGNRAWGSETEAEELLKSFRLKQEEMYSFKLISPTDAEKLLKKESPIRWQRAQKLVTQADPRPTVVRESDPRAAAYSVCAPAAEFDTVTDFDDLLGVA